MMGERVEMQDRLFYEFRLEEHVPAGHLLRVIDRFVDLSDLRRHLAGRAKCKTSAGFSQNVISADLFTNTSGSDLWDGPPPPAGPVEYRSY